MKKEIAQKYIELSISRPLSKITVKTLAEECHISRQTFYYYYEDAVEVLKDILVNFCMSLAKECAEEPDLNQSLKLFYLRIEAHFPFIRKILNSPFRDLAEPVAVKAVEEMLRNLSKGWEDVTFSSHEEVDFVFNLISHGIVGYLEAQAVHQTIHAEEWAQYASNIMQSRKVIRKMN